MNTISPSSPRTPTPRVEADRRRAAWRATGATFVLALAGCANVPAQHVVAERGAETAVPAPGPALASSPGSALTEEVLYKLLVAEIAGQRGRLDLAVSNYLSIARATRDPSVAERAVRISVFARDQERGLEAASIWAEVAPQDKDARRVHAALLIRAGRVEEAVAELGALVEAPNDTREGFAKIGDMLAREKDRPTSVLVMERLTSEHQRNPHALFAFAQLLARTGELERSLVVLDRVLDVEPDNVRAVIAAARIRQRQGDTAEALDALSSFLQANEESDEVRMTYARLLVDAKRYDDARAQFEKLAERSPKDADVAYALGLLLLQTSRFDAAEEQFARLRALGERVETASYYLGQIAEYRKDYEGALDAYGHVREGEHRLSAQIRVAVLMAEQGSVADAREHLRSLRTDNLQEAIRVYQAEAELLRRQSRMADAMQVYDDALEQFPKNTDLLYARAMLAEKMDRIEVLERDLRDILSREPNNADALNALGYTLADRTERYDEALELIERAYELKPNDHYIVDSMGWILYRLGRYEDALEHLRRAMELNSDPEIAAHLGEVLWVMGDREEAKRVWNAALENTPDDERLLDVIKRFGL